MGAAESIVPVVLRCVLPAAAAVEIWSQCQRRCSTRHSGHCCIVTCVTNVLCIAVDNLRPVLVVAVICLLTS